ncbi:hypothetical protein FRC12_024685 [Ceratobasidium sp. 428]|nr:hypothetical protein FRC12_024685 [Ceratobasidium sp. 428]
MYSTNSSESPPPPSMSNKRQPSVQYKIAGRDEPTVQVARFHSPSSRPSKKVSKRRKSGPRTVTFRVEGSLTPATDNSLDVPLAQSDQNMSDLPSESPPMSIFETEDAIGVQGQQDSAPVDLTGSKKTANDYLSSWLDDCSGYYLNAMYDSEAPPEQLACDECDEVVRSVYRCRSCLNSCFYCHDCLLAAHRFQPTHRVEYYRNGAWADTELADLGHVLCLGHQGKPCSESLRTWDLVVGDHDGFHTISVRYCAHPNSPSKALQLLAVGLFPCSDLLPRSAFTLSLLTTFNAILTVGRTSAHKYYSVLERITKPGFPEDVRDRYRELMSAHRKYLYLLNLQRSAHGFDPHVIEEPGDQALDCIACPRPGVNFNWNEVPQDEVDWFRAFLSYDGNFRSVRKSKKYEAGDICLSDGKAYVPLKALYKEWVDSQPTQQRTEKPTCDNHKAGNDTSVRWVGRDVTGIGALTCTSHSCFVPQGTVDFFKGERFIYADYAFASCATYLTRRFRLPFFLTYDVWCHWIVNFHKRADNLPYQISLPPDLDLQGAIPKWHLLGHYSVCYVRHSLDHKQYVGRQEGEGPERVWSHLNQHSGSTSEQSPGHRTDTLNNLAYEWNFEKMIRLAQHLPPKFKEAKRMLDQQKAAHLDLTASLPPDEVARWESMSIEPVQGTNGRWSSPLMDPVWNDGQFRTAVRTEAAKESKTSRLPRKRPGAARWIADGIELEHRMRNIRDDVKEIGLDPTPRQATSINKQRTTLRDQLLEYQKRQARYMNILSDQEFNHPDQIVPTDDEPEHSELGLPSSYLRETLLAADLGSLADLELELRLSMCNDSLEAVRHLLGAKAYALNYKNRHVRGEVATTRSEAGLRAHSAKISKARWRYDNSRKAALRLNPGAPNFQRYQEITDADLKTLQSLLDDTSRGVGQGYRAIPWIWRSVTGVNNDEWQIKALKTEWFRSRERYKRWEEQLVLLKREMVMTIRSFRMREGMWKLKASSTDSTPGMRGYALRQSAFYREHALRALQAFRDNLNDDIVTLKWADNWLHDNVDGLDFVDASDLPA